MEEMILKDLSALNWKSILDQALPNPPQLPKILARHNVTVPHLMQIARKPLNPNEPYGRQVLYRSPEVEVMLAKWSQNASSSPHNHGFSKGLIWFVQGDFKEQHFSFKDGQLAKTTEVTNYTEGDVAMVYSNDIHSSGPKNEGVSLHLYSPSIQDMKVWDLINKETLTVADECGAWVPSNSALITKRVKWA